MNIAPAIRYKITPPYLAHTLRRDRLIDLIDKHIQQKIILIMGQAAQGKSTIAASYVGRSDLPCAWINVEIHESDPARLFRTLTQAVFGATRSPHLKEAGNYPGIAMGLREEQLLYREWLRALTANISDPLLMVLDGLDRLTPEAGSYCLIEALIETVPPNIQLILTSREIPPIDIQKLKINQRVYILENEDLAFTEAEAKSFFMHVRRTPLEKWEIQQAHQITEGWIGGLVLLDNKLGRLSGEERKKLLTGDHLSQFKEEVFQYLDEEIFSSFSSQLQDLLIKASLFDTIDPIFLKRLLDVPRAETIFLELSQKNLFVQRTYHPGSRQVFRYHQLFRDFLKRKFERRNDEKVKQALLVKAGDLFLERETEEEALGCYLEARAYDRALPLFEKIGIRLLERGQQAELLRIVYAFPDRMLKNSPWLLFYLSMTRRFTGVKENLACLPEAVRMFKAMGNVRGLILSLSYLLEAVIAAGLPWKHLRTYLEKSERLLKSVHSDVYPYEKAFLLSQFGYGHTLRGNLQLGLSALQEAFLLASNIKNRIIQATVASHMVVNLTMLGRFSSGEAYARELGQLVPDCPGPEIKTLHWLTESMLASFKGEAETAENLLGLAQDCVNSEGLIYYLPIVLMYKVFYCVFSNKFDEMDEIGDQLVRLASSMNNEVLVASTTFFLGLNAYRRENFFKAQKILETCRELCSPEKTNTQVQWYASKVIIALLSEDRKSESQNKEIGEAVSFFKREKSVRFLAETYLAMGILENRQKRVDTARYYIDKGFQMAEEAGHRHFLLLCRRHAVEACLLAVTLAVKKSHEYISSLLCLQPPSITTPELENLVKKASPTVRKDVRRIIKAIRRTHMPILQISTLGRFRIHRGETLIEEEEWLSRQAENLLKVIITQENMEISKDLVAEILWPDHSPTASQRNFKVTLHRLRKTVEPEMNKHTGSSYIKLQDNILSLDSELVHVDAAHFRQLIRKGALKEKENDLKTAMALYQKAQALYKGDFLPQDLYSPWAESTRYQLKNQNSRLLLKMARLHENEQNFEDAVACYQKAFLKDPFMEEACQGLMMAYAKMGLTKKARSVFETFKAKLKNELDCEPEARTIEVYKKIFK